ncbi:MAG: hypothetical protein LLF76_00955 [Planctomycetaceae bacterium]|nr:hypothetical protein [Planctomycetaceae bacterium]
MIKKMRIASIAAMVLLSGGYVFAQELFGRTTETNIFGAVDTLHFFAALVCGLIIALALHAVLTTLSIALGISIAKPEKALAPGHEHEGSEKESKGISSTVRTINHAFGIWALVISSIAMFLAAWAGVRLSNSGSLWVGAIIGLSIWGISYLLMLAAETRIMSSAFGALFHTATGGIQTMGKGLGAVFSKSPARQAADVAGEVTARVREELFGDLDTKKLHKELDRYIRQLSPPTARQIKEELMDLLDKTELDAVVQTDAYGNYDFSHIRASLEEGGMTKEKAEHVIGSFKEAVHMLREESKSKDKLSAAADVAMKMAGRSPEESEQIRTKIETYLRNTNKEALNPEGIKRDFEKLFSSPREGLAALKGRLGSIDKETVTSVLEQRKDMTHQEAEKIVDHVERILHSIQSQLTGIRESVSGTAESQSRLESKLQNYLNSLGRPELRYKDVKEDVKLLFHDPKTGIDQLLERLKSIDRNTLKALIASSSKKLSQEDAEHIITRIESARDEVVAKTEQMKQRVADEVNKARQMAADTVQETRKNAATAAWWSFACAVCSALAAAGGGLLAIGV